MKYKNIPKVAFKKGTPKRKRRAFRLVHESIWFRNGEKYMKVMEQAAFDQIFYGRADVGVFWDGDDVSMENVTEWDM